MPTDENDRLIIGFGKTDFAAELAMLWMELLILGVGHLERTHVEGLTDCDFVNRVFVEVAIAAMRPVIRQFHGQWRFDAPYQKSSWLDAHELHPDGVRVRFLLRHLCRECR
jgi:hypothetical protein